MSVDAPELICGDCLAELPRLDADSVHLLLTDPPYFLDGLDANWRKGKASATKATGSVGGLPVGMKFDPGQGKALQEFIASVGTMCLRVMKPGAFAVVFSQPRLAHRMATGLEDAGFEIRDLLAWRFTRRAQFKAFGMDHFIRSRDMTEAEKTAAMQRMAGRKTPQLRPQFETMILAQKPKAGTHVDNWLEHETGLIDARVSLDGMSPSTIMTVEKPRREKYNCHLTVKPVQLIEHLIGLFSTPGQVVLDPFIGSGTTALAARNLGRECVGVEINPDYVKIAQQRLRVE